MIWVGTDLKTRLFPTPAVGWVPPPAQAAQGPSMTLGTCRDGAPMASLGTLSQGLTAL